MGLDEDVFLALNGAGNPVLDPLAVALGVAGLFALTAAWALPLWVGRRRREAVDLLVLLVVAEAIVFALKWGLAVSRPEIGFRLVVPFDDPSDASFPSGHATRAFAVAALLTIRMRTWRWGVPLFAYASAMTISRVYAGFHWPSDVLAGAFLGIGLAFALDRLTRVPAYAIRRDALISRLASLRPARK